MMCAACGRTINADILMIYLSFHGGNYAYLCHFEFVMIHFLKLAANLIQVKFG